MIGYIIEQELKNALDHEYPVVMLLTQILVDAKDPACQNPTKFIGPVYERDGDKWRPVVASPLPQEIPDMGVLLLEHGVIVICTGGGGIPVMRQGTAA